MGAIFLVYTPVLVYRGDKTENSNGSWDYWIVKSDSLGNIQWQNTIGGSGDDKLYSVKQTMDGGYILGGSSSSFISGDKTEPSTGGHDFWILKTDSTGNIQWQNTIWGSNNDELISIYQTADGGYALGGYSKSFISGDKSENSLMQSIPCYDFWIIKTDPAGSIQWQNTIGGSNDEYLTSFKQTIDGGSILGEDSHPISPEIKRKMVMEVLTIGLSKYPISTI
ncbi:MAG: hypothetical protein IPN36_02025 [Bacteroidetes bacterium]|nr:hypothetical protein [Bacteroidota bacterium]